MNIELKELIEDNECILADGFDNAIVGVSQGVNPVVIYDVSLCIDVLVKQGMSHEDALEFFDFNVSGSYVGEKTPIFVNVIESEGAEIYLHDPND
tara:strand:- start:17 stop:301 length:285 start_codon:yes stop_codon:yes gene_type:complete